MENLSFCSSIVFPFQTSLIISRHKKYFKEQKCGYWTWSLDSCHLWFRYFSPAVLYMCSIKEIIPVNVAFFQQNSLTGILLLLLSVVLTGRRICSLQLMVCVFSAWSFWHLQFATWGSPHQQFLQATKELSSRLKEAVAWHCRGRCVHCASSAPTGFRDICGSWSKNQWLEKSVKTWIQQIDFAASFKALHTLY